MAGGEDTMAVTVRRHRFTLDEYHRMGETGILGEDSRVEGEIIEISPIGSRHAGTVARIQHLFTARGVGSESGHHAAAPVGASARRRPARAPG